MIFRLQDIGQDKIRIGLVSFADQVNVDDILPLNQSDSESVVLSAIGSQSLSINDGKISSLF